MLRTAAGTLRGLPSDPTIPCSHKTQKKPSRPKVGLKIKPAVGEMPVERAFPVIFFKLFFYFWEL